MIVTLIRVQAEITEPWVVGAPELADDPDELTCRRTPFGELDVPASLIAGALRHHLSRQLPHVKQHADEVSLEELMGSSPPRAGTPTGAVIPSAVRVLGTSLETSAATEFRTTTAIDPRRGAARTHTLRSAELAEPGAQLEIFLRIDSHGTSEVRDVLLGHLRRWTFFVGRGRTSGRGRTVVTEVQWGELDLATPSGLATWMRSGGPSLVRDIAVTPVSESSAIGTTPPVLEMQATFRARDAVLTHGPRPLGAPANSHHSRQSRGQFLMSGTSLKGVLRSRAGYICRTLEIIDEEACCSTDGCHEANCPLCFLFGSTERRGHVRIHDAVLGTGTTVTRTHVAIDRISGGAADQRLFTEQGIPFRPTMELRVTADPATSTPNWVTTLMNAVILDMHDGYVTIGARGATGLGHMELVSPEAVTAARQHLRQNSLRDQIELWRAETAATASLSEVGTA